MQSHNEDESCYRMGAFGNYFEDEKIEEDDGLDEDRDDHVENINFFGHGMDDDTCELRSTKNNASETTS